MDNEVKLSSKVEFTVGAFIIALTNFYDKLAENQDEINDYTDIMAIAKDFAIDCYKEQKSEGEDEP